MAVDKLDLQTYNQLVVKRIADFELESPQNNKKLMQDLYDLTKNYLTQNYGAKKFKTIQLFRHGECTSIDKGLGLKPNANINDEANANMKRFDYSALLHNENDPVQVVFSTMTRATVTAANFIQGLKKHIEVKAKSSNKITEIAEGPSGFGIEKPEEYWTLMNPKSGVQLSHRIMLFFSWLFYSLGSTLEDNKIAKDNALQTIRDNSEFDVSLHNEETPDLEESLDLEESVDSKELPSLATKKLSSHSSDVTHITDMQRKSGLGRQIVDEIDKKGTNDMIIVGHGNSIRDTLSALFKGYEKQHREDDELDFGEGQSLMSFEDDTSEKQVFMLPFRIQVDQHDPGKMNVRSVDFAEVTDYLDVEEAVLLNEVVLPEEERAASQLANDFLPSYGLISRITGKNENRPRLVFRAVDEYDSEDEDFSAGNKSDTKGEIIDSDYEEIDFSAEEAQEKELAKTSVRRNNKTS